VLASNTPPNKALNRTANSFVQLTLDVIWRHTRSAGSGPVSAVASRLTLIRWADTGFLLIAYDRADPLVDDCVRFRVTRRLERAHMTFASRYLWIPLLCLVALACGHVEPAPQTSASKYNIVFDEAFFEIHPKSQAAWSGYALQQVASTGEGVYLIEVESRRTMIEYWKEEGPAGVDAYLDLMVEIEDLGFLEEYVIAAFLDFGWVVPGSSMSDLDVPAFVAWAGDNLQGHSGDTRASVTRPPIDVPGAHYPLPESFFTAEGLLCDKSDELDGVLEQWGADRKMLVGRLIAAPDGMSFLYALDELGTGGELIQTGATMVPLSIAELNFLGGFCAVDRGDLKLARGHLMEASSLDSRNTTFRMELAFVSVHMGEFEFAEEQIEFVHMNTEDPCTIARALRLQGYIEIERGDLTDAYESYTKSLDYEPGNQLARNELSVIYHTMESQGFENLPPSEYVPPPGGQLLTTMCGL
jgi:hypothetical protein